MSSTSQSNAQDDEELEATIDQAIDACGGNMRATICGLSAGWRSKRLTTTSRSWSARSGSARSCVTA